MTFFDRVECKATLARLDLLIGPARPELRVDIVPCLDRSVALVRLLLSLFGAGQASFLWVREYGIWCPLENPDLFRSVRAVSGCDATVHDMPGQMFEAGESDRLLTYLQIMILSGWGGVLVGCGNHHRIAISHDTWVSVRSSDHLDSQIEQVGAFGLAYRMEDAPEELTGLGDV